MKVIRSSFFAILLMAFSCQHADDDLVTQNVAETITPDSPLAQLILRVSQNAVSYDNVLDNSDCFSVQLPVNIMVDGQGLTVRDEANFDEVWDIMDESGDDDDQVHFSYPITIIYRDFTEVTVNSYQQLEQLSPNCDDDGFHEIRCLGFNFPLRINTYNTASQIAGSTQVNDNMHLYGLLHNASPDSLLGIAFPITVTNADGDDVTINNNIDLENAIESSIGTCDGEEHGGGPEPSTLNDIIIIGNWHVSYCQGPEEETYGGYSFTFLKDGMIDVVKNSMHSGGSWDLHPTIDDDMLNLDFTNNGLSDIEGDWRIIEYNDEEIRLKKDDDGAGGPGGDDDYLYFRKN